MKNNVIKRILMVLSMIGCFAFYAEAQINNSEVFFYKLGDTSTYVIKFDYLKDNLYLKIEDRKDVVKKLSGSQNFYENEIWEGSTGNCDGDIIRYSKKMVDGYTRYQHIFQRSLYSKECISCKTKCNQLKKKTPQYYIDCEIDCEGCGKHGHIDYNNEITILSYGSTPNIPNITICDRINVPNRGERIIHHNTLTGLTKDSLIRNVKSGEKKIDIVPGYSKSTQSNTYTQNTDNTIYFFQDYVVKFDQSKQKVYLRNEYRRNITNNLARSESYYENDSWSSKDIVIYQWDESKQKYALYSGERQLIYDGNCSICRKKCDEAWEYYQGVPEEDLAGFEDMVFGSGCERYACGKHGYYWTNVSYLEFDSDMQEMYLQEGDGKTGTLKAIQTFIRTEKADYKPKVNGSNKFPSNIKLTTFDGTLVSSSSFLNNNKPHIIHIHVYYQSLSSRLQKLFDAVCEDWGNKYNAELVTIDVSDRGGKKQYPYDCDTKFYYDELDDLKDNYLPHLFPNAKSHGFSTIIFVVNKNSEIVYSHWISNNDEIESIIEVITQKLQEIK